MLEPAAAISVSFGSGIWALALIERLLTEYEIYSYGYDGDWQIQPILIS